MKNADLSLISRPTGFPRVPRPHDQTNASAPVQVDAFGLEPLLPALFPVEQHDSVLHNQALRPQRL